MDALIQKKYFSGRSEPGVWSSIYTYKPQNLDLRKVRGEIFAVICLRGPEEFDLAVAGNMLLDRMHETYFENRKDSTLIALEKALLETSHYLQKFLEHDENGNQGVDLDIIAQAMIEDVVYLVSLGKGKVFALRDGIISELSDSLKDPTGEGMIAEASLIAKKGDVFVIGTPQLKAEVGTNELEKAAAGFNDGIIKNRTYEEEAAVSMMMIGFNIDRNVETTLPQVAIENVEALPEIEKETEQDMGEMISQDAAAVTIEAIQSVETEEAVNTELEAETDSDLTLEDLVIQEQHEHVYEPEMELGVEEEQLPVGEADLTEEDKFEDALIEETAVVETNPKMRFPANVLTKAKSGFSSILIKAKSLLPKKKEVITNEQIEESTDFSADQPFEKETSAKVEIFAKQQMPQTKASDDTANMKTYQVFLKKFLAGLLTLLKKIKALVWDKWLGMGVDKNNVYAKNAANKRKWGLLIVLILVIAGVTYLSFQNLAAEQQVKAALEKDVNALTEAKNLIQEVNSKVSIYAKLAADDVRKAQPLQTLADAQKKLDDAKSNTAITADITAQETLIAEIKDKFNKIIPITADNYIVDVANLFRDIKIADMVVSNKTIYLLPSDKNVSKIYSVDYNGNNPKEIKVDLVNPKSMTVDDKGNLIVLDENPDRGLVIINPSDGSSTRIAATSSSALSGATQIDFSVINGQGRIYLIKPTDKSINYYSKTGSSYSTITKRNNIEELSTAKDLVVIDGKIYLIMQVAEGLYRDYNRTAENIDITGLKAGDNLLGASALYVDGTYIYIADPTQKRIVVLIKDVINQPLVAQYTYKGPSTTSWTGLKEIVADRDAQKIFVLDQARVYVLNMNQLLDFLN